jgi:hypothetical protein
VGLAFKFQQRGSGTRGQGLPATQLVGRDEQLFRKLHLSNSFPDWKDILIPSQPDDSQDLTYQRPTTQCPPSSGQPQQNAMALATRNPRTEIKANARIIDSFR